MRGRFRRSPTSYVMSQVKVDIKLLLTLAAILCGLGGFYYTTQLRLDNLETTIDEKSCGCELELDNVKKQVATLKKRIKKLERN